MTLIIAKATPEEEAACEKALDEFVEGFDYETDDLEEELDALMDCTIRQMRK